MKPQVFLSVFAIAALMLACSAIPATSQPSPLPAATQPAQNTVIPPTNTPPAETATATLTALPTNTATITPTPTPSVPMLTTLDKPVNCRFGPGVEYSAIGALKLGETAQIQGRTEIADWWYISLPQNPATLCWVAANVTVVSGNTSALGIIAPPAAFVTDVSLTLDPTDITVPGCSFPYTPVKMSGLITTNGPASVEWHWETSQGNTSSTNTLKFTTFGTKTVEDYVKYGAEGNYWVKLVITSPNGMAVKASYKVVCGP